MSGKLLSPFFFFFLKNCFIKTLSSSKMYHPWLLGPHVSCSFSFHEDLFLERKTPALGAVPISWLDFIKYSRALWKGSRGSASGCGSQTYPVWEFRTQTSLSYAVNPGVRWLCQSDWTERILLLYFGAGSSIQKNYYTLHYIMSYP